MGRDKAILIVVAVIVVTLVGGGLLLNFQRSNEPLDEEEEAIVETGDPDPAADLVVTLEEFGDYQSQSCAELYPTLRKLRTEYGKNLNMVFRNIPSISNKNALLAAQTAEAARMQSRFWEMHDLLFEKQKEWKDEENPLPKFVQWAGELGLDVTRLQKDIESDPVKLRLEADREAALALGIQELPSIVLNGRRLKTDAMNAEGIREGIEVMLTRGAEEAPVSTP